MLMVVLVGSVIGDCFVLTLSFVMVDFNKETLFSIASVLSTKIVRLVMMAVRVMMTFLVTVVVGMMMM